MLTSGTSHSCTFWAPLTESKNVHIYTSAPLMLQESVLEFVGGEMTTVGTFVSLEKLVFEMAWNCYSPLILISAVYVECRTEFRR